MPAHRRRPIRWDVEIQRRGLKAPSREPDFTISSENRTFRVVSQAYRLHSGWSERTIKLGPAAWKDCNV